MHFEVWTRGLAALSVDCLVLGIFEEGTLTEEAQAVDAALGGRLRKLLARGDFSGRTGETLLLTDLPGIEATRVLLTGLGGRKSLARRPWRKALTAALSALARTRITSAAIAIERPPAKELDDYYLGRAVAEIAGSALYRINDLKTAKKQKLPALQKLLAGPVRKTGVEAATQGLAHGAAVANAVRVQRDLANLPANVCTPAYLAEQARALAKRFTKRRVRLSQTTNTVPNPNREPASEAVKIVKTVSLIPRNDI